MEKSGVLTATFVSTPFRTLGLKRKEALGVPQAQLIWVPHPMMNLLPPAIEDLADQILADVIESFVSRLKARTRGAQ